MIQVFEVEVDTGDDGKAVDAERIERLLTLSPGNVGLGNATVVAEEVHRNE
jgi:hypothetical protein